MQTDSHYSSRDKYNKMKVEEQMVPSGGFSPQPENSNSSYNGINYYGSSMSQFDDCTPYGNLADTFDLSLLGDSYDHDMAMVPSPMASLEASWQQQASLYAPSPSSEFRAFSPDCMKPFSNNRDQMTPAVPNNKRLSKESMICSNNGISNSLSPHNDVESCERNALLRQCLEDTSFQTKYNFKPVDLPTITVNDGLDSITKSEFQSGSNSMEIFSLAYEQMRSDVQNTCNILSISQDPAQWSVGDAQSWLVHSMEGSPSNESNVCAALRNFWNMDGRTLSSLSEEDFRSRDAINGDKLYASLELWKMLQWSGLGTPMSQDIDLDSIVGTPINGTCLSGGSSPASICPSDDIKVFTVIDTLMPPKFPTSPSSVGTASKNSDDEESEDDDEKPVVKGNKGIRPHGSKSGAHIHLWQFLKELLESGQQHGSCIRWLDQSRGVFKIEDSVRVARLWGLRKNRPAMNYDKLSRSIRQYYRKGIMRKTERSQRLVYQFCHPYGC